MSTAAPIPTSADTGRKIGIWELQPGIGPANFYALLGAAFFSIGLLTMLGNLRPYLFNEMLMIPPDLQGRISGTLEVASELPALLLSSLIGAASDKLGRRVLYAMGFLILSIGFFLFPFVGYDWTLYGMVVLCAIGSSLISAMLGAVIADYPKETSRGKLVGIAFFLNGLGVATLVLFATKLPKMFQDMGFNAFDAGRLAYWCMALLCLVPLVLVARWLAEASPSRLKETEPLLTTLRIGIAAARDKKILLAYLSAGVSRASLSIISSFFFLWMVRAGQEQGLSTAEAYAKGGAIFGVIQATATFWAVIVISFIDRINRVFTMTVAFALAGLSYTAFGLVENPFSPIMFVFAMFLGIGEMSGVLASQALIGQVAPERGRGACIGVFTLFGSMGILLSSLVGGFFFDVWRPSAPYILMGLTSGVLCLFSLYVLLSTRYESTQPVPA